MCWLCEIETSLINPENYIEDTSGSVRRTQAFVRRAENLICLLLLYWKRRWNNRKKNHCKFTSEDTRRLQRKKKSSHILSTWTWSTYTWEMVEFALENVRLRTFFFNFIIRYFLFVQKKERKFTHSSTLLFAPFSRLQLDREQCWEIKIYEHDEVCVCCAELFSSSLVFSNQIMYATEICFMVCLMRSELLHT